MTYIYTVHVICSAAHGKSALWLSPMAVGGCDL